MTITTIEVKLINKNLNDKNLLVDLISFFEKKGWIWLVFYEKSIEILKQIYLTIKNTTIFASIFRFSLKILDFNGLPGLKRFLSIWMQGKEFRIRPTRMKQQ